jgi:probable rRNA maturation factor
VEVAVDNRLPAGRVDEEALAARLERVLRLLDQPPESFLSVVITDDADIAALNQEYLSRPGPTNVLAFGQAEGEGAELSPGLLGDVVVSHQSAMREAAESGLELDEHLMRLLVHGLLHLLGYDHTKGPGQARRMEELTEELLAQSGPEPGEGGARWPN